MSRATWSAVGVTVTPVLEYEPKYGVRVQVDTRTQSLPPTLVSSLRDWLTWHLRDNGTTPPPADPDRVRAEIDVQRAALLERLRGTTDEITMLAWVEHALDSIERACTTVVTP